MKLLETQPAGSSVLTHFVEETFVFLFSLVFHCRPFWPWWPLACFIFSPPLQNFKVFLPTNERGAWKAKFHLKTDRSFISREIAMWYLLADTWFWHLSIHLRTDGLYNWQAGFNLCKIFSVKLDIGLHAVYVRAGARDAITKFSRIDSSPHFLSYGEYARAQSAREQPR